jgi:RNA polymerase sigma-70 factor (ECF subfamily)
VLAGQDLAAAFAELKPLSRSVVWLHDVEGYTHDEIAQLMGKTKSFSKSQLARAHERLRALLDEPSSQNGHDICTIEPKVC